MINCKSVLLIDSKFLGVVSVMDVGSGLIVVLP